MYLAESHVWRPLSLYCIASCSLYGSFHSPMIMNPRHETEDFHHRELKLVFRGGWLDPTEWHMQYEQTSGQICHCYVS